jgi:hypothetical protein
LFARAEKEIVSRSGAKQWVFLATGPSDFSAPPEKSPKELVSTIGPRRISLCGATFFARGGKGNERDPIFLWTCQRKTVSPAKKRVAFEAVLK